MKKTLCMAFLSGVLLSACSSPYSPTEENNHHASQLQTTEKIQQLILRCIVRDVYYSWSDDKSAQVGWYTTGQTIQVYSPWYSGLQSCVDQLYRTQPFTFQPGLSGKMEIHSR